MEKYKRSFTPASQNLWCKIENLVILTGLYHTDLLGNQKSIRDWLESGIIPNEDYQK